MKTVNGRFNLTELFYSFVDVDLGPAWTGSKLVNTANIEDYYGEKFENLNLHILQASFYFISSEQMSHEKFKYSIANLLGDLGGFSTTLLAAAVYFAKMHSEKVIYDKLIRHLFHIY